MLIDGPVVQYCGDVYKEIGEPISNVYFKKEDSIVAFNFVWLKICGGYSNSDDFFLKLNGVTADVVDDVNDDNKFFIKHLHLIKDKNVFQIELKSRDAFQYFKSMFIYPIRYEGGEEIVLIEIEKW